MSVCLNSLTFQHVFLYFLYEFVVLQPPPWLCEQLRRRLADEALEYHVGAAVGDELADEPDVFVGCQPHEVVGVVDEFLCHACALDELQLVELEYGDGQFGQSACCGEHVVCCLARQPEYDVPAYGDAPCCCPAHGVARATMVVPAVYSSERQVVATLDAILYEDKHPTVVQLLQVVEQWFGHAVGACADDQSHHVFHCQRFLVFGLERIQAAVGVGVCLKVSEVFHCRVFLAEKVLALSQLLCDRLVGTAVLGVECLVVAVGASACAHRAVAVGTGEPGVDGYLLHLLPELAVEPCSEIVVLHRSPFGLSCSRGVSTAVVRCRCLCPLLPTAKIPNKSEITGMYMRKKMQVRR